MISTPRSDTAKLLHYDQQDIPSASLTRSTDALPSNWKNTQHRVVCPMDLLTVHHDPHILNKTINDFSGLCGSYTSLVLGEPIQPLEYCFDLLFSEKFLEEKFCDTFESNYMISHPTQTYLTFLALSV